METRNDIATREIMEAHDATDLIEPNCSQYLMNWNPSNTGSFRPNAIHMIPVGMAMLLLL